MKKIAGLLLFVLSSIVLRADDVVPNQWKPLGDGSYAPPTGNWPNLSGSAFLWLTGFDFGVVAPILTEGELKAGPGYRKISFDTAKWEFVPGVLPEKGPVPSNFDSPRGYIYLPQAKKILFLKEKWSWNSYKGSVHGWLLDIEKAVWEPLHNDFLGTDLSTNFNTTKGLDGLATPVWGSMCYDAHNQEAVAFGGGAIWGRVGNEVEEIQVGQWYFDEKNKRTVRLTPDSDQKNLKARRWYPGHSGTILFSEKELQWSFLEQPLAQQPTGRILPGMAYDSDQKKIVLFGGDDLARCFNDTWIYDCATRTWSEAKAKNPPPARAGHAMVYVPDQKVILLIGGYTAGWKETQDVWAYQIEENKWTQLDLSLPQKSGMASADYDAKRGFVVLVAYPKTRTNGKMPVYSLKLDFSTVGKVQEVAAIADRENYHCVSGLRYGGKLPDEVFEEMLTVKDSKVGVTSLTEQEANRWVLRKPPFVPRDRNWGSNVYDYRTHKAYTWGGGHSTYPGADVIEYDVTLDRWIYMADAPNYNPIWLHGMVSGPPGASFGGWSLLPTHARKSYGIDELSNMLIIYTGDLYDLKNRMYVGNIGLTPGGYGVSDQVSFCSTPHGLYAYSAPIRKEGLLVKANVAEHKWDQIAVGGPKNHHEYSHLAYDSKRDQLVYFAAVRPEIWIFDFASKTWKQEEVQGANLEKASGDSTYIPELDAIFIVCPREVIKNQKPVEQMFFYKLAEHKWYTAPYEGDPFLNANSGKDFSPFYDAKLKAIIRVCCVNKMQVATMRLDLAALKLVPLE